jgi:hypothetical protein
MRGGRGGRGERGQAGTRTHPNPGAARCPSHARLTVMWSYHPLVLRLRLGASMLSTRCRAVSSGRERVRDAKETLLVMSKPKRRLAGETRWQAPKTDDASATRPIHTDRNLLQTPLLLPSPTSVHDSTVSRARSASQYQ